MEPVAARNASTRIRPLIDELRDRDSLQWFAELGLGYYPVRAKGVYNGEYFAKYQAYAVTDMGRRLNTLRVALVRRHWLGDVVDVGIGCGSFVEAMQEAGGEGKTHGFDVSPTAVRWLLAHNLFVDPYVRQVPAVTMWDSLEHIENFHALLRGVGEFVFLSLPIFEGMNHALHSRHYRKTEHCWYFTAGGLRALMARLGWQLVEANDAETEAGRDGIGSFVFRRGPVPCS